MTLGYAETLKRGFAVVRGDGAVVTSKAAAERAAALEIAARVLEAIEGTRLGGDGVDRPAVAGTVPLVPRRKTG